MTTKATSPKRKPLSGLYDGARQDLIFVIALSCLINLLMLTGPLFMMQVYDRVLASQSLQTLGVLLALVVVLYALQSFMDGVRGRASNRLAARADAVIAPKVFKLAGFRARSGADGDAGQPLRDLDTLRQFRAGQGPLTLFDLPWTPIYLGVICIFHPILGLLALGGAVILFALTLVADRMSAQAQQEVSKETAKRNILAQSSLQDSETLVTLGIFDRLAKRWLDSHSALLNAQLSLSDRAGTLAATAKGFRFLLNSLTLAGGAWLVIRGELSPGAMMATSVISSRALAPIEQGIAQWRGWISARAAATRLETALAALPGEGEGVALPPPERELVLTNMAVLPPKGQKPLVQGVNLTLKAGDGLGVIGPSGAGKTSFIRGLLGQWQVNDGAVRLDGATPDQWPEGVAAFTGYLPQDTRLLPGTIAENIARFTPDADMAKILEAARLAQVHDLILSLPEGYNCQIGEGGATLSAGQRQRIALARAVFGAPFLIVMDEPNANLDAEGDQALAQAIHALRAAGKIVVCIAHRPSALTALNMVLMIEAGKMRSFGPRDEVLGQVVRHPRAVQN